MARLAANFGLGAPTRYEAIAAGTVNSNFALETDRGRYFVRVNEGKTEGDVVYEAELVGALARAGVATPPPLLARDGRPFAVHDGSFVSAFPWVPGQHRCQAGLTPDDNRALGAALARLHVAGLPLAERFDRSGIYTYADIVGRFEGFRQSDDDALAEAIPAIAAEIEYLDARGDERAAAPRGVIHGDLFRDNVLFDDRGNVAALIDFEQASTGSFAYDLAVCLNSWCFGDDFDADLVGALVAGYESVRTIEDAGRAALYTECRAAAMRFCVTRITDVHLADTVATKDFRRYLRRLERWRALGPEFLNV